MSGWQWGKGYHKVPCRQACAPHWSWFAYESVGVAREDGLPNRVVNTNIPVSFDCATSFQLAYSFLNQIDLVKLPFSFDCETSFCFLIKPIW